jgi:TetR/AcrR family transcriptional regulator
MDASLHFRSKTVTEVGAKPVEAVVAKNLALDPLLGRGAFARTNDKNQFATRDATKQAFDDCCAQETSCASDGDAGTFERLPNHGKRSTIWSVPPLNETPNRAKTLGPTAARIVEVALTTFASKGFGATSLDTVASAAGCTKQTLLHHFGSKDGLLDAVLERVAEELGEAIDAGLSNPEGEWQRLDAVLRAVFRLAARRPELLSLVREVGRLGTPFVGRLASSLEVLSERAIAFFRIGVSKGVFRPHDHRLVLLSAYSSVVAAATEVETLRQLGVEPDIRILVRRRRALRSELKAILSESDTPLTAD